MKAHENTSDLEMTSQNDQFFSFCHTFLKTAISYTGAI